MKKKVTEEKPVKKPGRPKSRPKLRKSDGSEFERIDAEGLALRAQMIKDGVDVGKRPPMMSKEDYWNLPKCGARRKGANAFDEDGNQQFCQNVAGARTDHLGVGRCWLHGGRNKGARRSEAERIKQIKTGEQETITYDTLTPEEQELWASVSTTTTTQLEHDLKVITIRERRMLNRIAELVKEGKMSVIENTDEEKMGIDGLETKKVKKSSTNLERIQDIEEALTRVNKQKLNIMESLEKARNGGSTKIDVRVGGKKGSPILTANLDLSNVPIEELQRQLDMLEELEDDDD